jgi:hypothetical protein
VVLNDNFRPPALYIQSTPGKADRLAARIWTQAQREQIGETEGSLDVQPVIGFKSDTARELRIYIMQCTANSFSDPSTRPRSVARTLCRAKTQLAGSIAYSAPGDQFSEGRSPE